MAWKRRRFALLLLLQTFQSQLFTGRNSLLEQQHPQLS
jgi:hypothetical protein